MLIFIKVFAFIFLINTRLDTKHNNLVPALELTNYFQPYRFVTVLYTATGRISLAQIVLLTRAVRTAHRNKIQYLEKTPQKKNERAGDFAEEI